jgi:putative spermidine/putrescine transport system substrate-binding protein
MLWTRERARWLLLGALTLTVASVLAACGSSDKKATSADTNSTTQASGSTAPDLKGKELRLVTYGGTFLENYKKSVIDPFAEETGVKVTIDDTCCDKQPTALKAGQYGGDVLYGQDRGVLLNWKKQGLLEADPAVLEMQTKAGVAEELRDDTVVPVSLYAYIIAAKKGLKVPANWTEFWDTKAFPGPRALTSVSPQPILEAALMADGAAADSLYPLDVDRAFNKIAELRKQTRVRFATTGAEQIQFLATGESNYSLVYSNRAYEALRDGVGIGVSFGQQLSETVCASLLKGAKNKEAALAFIEYSLRPDVQAAFAEASGLSPTVDGADAKIPADIAKQLPTSADNTATAVSIDDQYWMDNNDKLFKRWTPFIAE